jgi:cell filamentation protein
MVGDPYVYPGTSTLKNLRDIRDPEELRAFEARASFTRLTELQVRPIEGNFDRAHLQAIHKHIFQDVYAWAGKPRENVDIAKPGSPFFALSQFIVPSLDEVFAKLRAEQYLRGLDADAFALRAGYYLGEINAVHPFREGNGRAQQEFIRELGERSGHRIEWSRVSREMMYHTSELSFRGGDSSGLAAVISAAIVAPSDERRAFVEHARDAMRAAKTTILTSAIDEQVARAGAIVSGRVIASDDRYVALATGPRSFAVLEQGKLSRKVAIGDRVKARVGAAEIAIEPHARPRGQERNH